MGLRRTHGNEKHNDAHSVILKSLQNVFRRSCRRLGSYPVTTECSIGPSPHIAAHKKQMPFLAGRGAWPSALARARSLRLSERSGRRLTEEAGGSGAGFHRKDRTKNYVPQIRGRLLRRWVKEGSSEGRLLAGTSSRARVGFVLSGYKGLKHPMETCLWVHSKAGLRNTGICFRSSTETRLIWPSIKERRARSLGACSNAAE